MIVARTVELISAALGHHLHLAAGGPIEIGALIGDAYFEFLDGFHWGRHHPGGYGGSANTKIARSNVVSMAAFLIVAVISSVELKLALVLNYTGDLASGRDGRLQDEERFGVAAEVRKIHQGYAGDR